MKSLDPLPIITYDDFNEAVDIIQSKAKPLSLYLFSEDENTHRVLNELSFGGGAINDTLMHLANPTLPFVVSECLALDNIMVNILSKPLAIASHTSLGLRD